VIAETGAAIGGIKAAFDIVKGISALKTETERNEAIISIQRILLEAQESALSDKQAIGELRARLDVIERADRVREDWEREKARYVLTRSPMGAYFYALRPEMAAGEVQHRLCATCYHDARKSLLHTIASHNGGEMVICQRCEKQTMLTDFQGFSIPSTTTAFNR
jgi:superfamily II helicase